LTFWATLATTAHLLGSGLQFILIGHAISVGVDFAEAVFAFLLGEGEELFFGDLAVGIGVDLLQELGHAIAAVAAGLLLAVLGVGQACGDAAGKAKDTRARFHGCGSFVGTAA
jgi:hypothetical protein